MGFMDGYTREPQTAERLLGSVRAAMYAFPNQRLGQIIDNALCVGDQKATWDGPDIFNIYDEALTVALDKYVALHTQPSTTIGT